MIEANPFPQQLLNEVNNRDANHTKWTWALGTTFIATQMFAPYLSPIQFIHLAKITEHWGAGREAKKLFRETLAQTYPDQRFENIPINYWQKHGKKGFEAVLIANHLLSSGQKLRREEFIKTGISYLNQLDNSAEENTGLFNTTLTTMEEVGLVSFEKEISVYITKPNQSPDSSSEWHTLG